MKDLLEENPNGLKDSFEQYFKMLPTHVRKVSNYNFPIPLALTLFCVQTYKDCATAAVRILVLCA
jgi:hypothetical protein